MMPKNIIKICLNPFGDKHCDYKFGVFCECSGGGCSWSVTVRSDDNQKQAIIADMRNIVNAAGKMVTSYRENLNCSEGGDA